MRLLMIGDVIGKPGRKALSQLIPGLRREYDLDLVIANGENAAGGRGITPATADEIIASGVDVITTGNHVWAQREILPYLEGQTPVLRPLNYPPEAPGRGYLQIKHVVVVNLIGRTFMQAVDCPFRTADALLASMKDQSTVVIDFHAEATSEKVALGRYLAGRVSAVLGTHTHIGTVDTCILHGGTAYVTDVGMVGPEDSIIGDDTDSVLSTFIMRLPHRVTVGKGRTVFHAVIVEIDETSGKALSIMRIKRETS